jgi:hypothetical protein
MVHIQFEHFLYQVGWNEGRPDGKVWLIVVSRVTAGIGARPDAWWGRPENEGGNQKKDDCPVHFLTDSMVILRGQSELRFLDKKSPEDG